ncbi:MAG TPA: serine hydrolase domain-containing protein [Bryobacteraceae bacterium]|nr:serine hydrolase domain-containing protein [Bryobacteraceae bacterium]
MIRRLFLPLLLAAMLQAQLPEATERAIGEIVRNSLEASGTPSASIAVVKDGKLAFAQAYGNARVNPDAPATPGMRYKIASNSKQIAAAAILLLAEERKLSLDDKVAKYLPELTRAGEITIRQLLSHTSGYQDYYPLDYVAPFMAKDTTPDEILTKWAKIPLDFEPGARWQYSNTNYVAIGRIIEKVSKKPLMEFLRSRILDRLQMKSAIDVTSTNWSAEDPVGYLHYATGPLRPAAPEGNNWMWAAGELGMTASDLARWDISLIGGSVLKPASLKTLTTEVQLTGGTGTHYALGLSVSTLANGHRRWAHSGGASGFVSRNITYPDDRLAITVLTNCDGGPAAEIAKKIEELLLARAADPGAAGSLEKAKRIYAGLVAGRVERKLISDDLAAYFTPQAVADFSASLKALGAPESFAESDREDRGGMVHRSFLVVTPMKKLRISAFVEPDGRFAQYIVTVVP